MFKLGVTGGIGAGKSTASHFFRLKGATIFDADEESKNLLTSTLPLQKIIMQAFGSNHFINNKFDLTKLSEIAFLNPINQKILNDIMWPEVFQLIKIASNIAENNEVLPKNFLCKYSFYIFSLCTKIMNIRRIIFHSPLF